MELIVGKRSLVYSDGFFCDQYWCDSWCTVVAVFEVQGAKSGTWTPYFTMSEMSWCLFRSWAQRSKRLLFLHEEQSKLANA